MLKIAESCAEPAIFPLTLESLASTQQFFLPDKANYCWYDSSRLQVSQESL